MAKQNRDVSNYQSWEKVTMPSGEVGYIMPETGLIYLPERSKAEGRSVFTRNPKPQMDAQAKEEAQRQAQIDLANKQASPAGQAIPVALGVAGAAGGLALANSSWLQSPQALATIAKENALTAQIIANTPGGAGAAGAAGAAAAPVATAAPAAQTAGQSFTNAAVGAPEILSVGRAPSAVGSAMLPDGSPGILLSDGSVIPDLAAGAPPPTTSYGSFLQGAGGALQGYQAYNAYKEGNMLGAGIYGAAGAANIGAALGNATATQYAGYANPAAGAYGLYENAKYVGSAPAGGQRNTMSTAQGAAAGAAIGSAVGLPWLGAGVGALYGLGMSTFGSSKDKYQMIRDEGRKGLQKAGLLDAEWKGTLADGSKFDFGKDGKGQTELDYKDPLTGQAIALANVIATGEGAQGKAREAMAKLYAAAIMSNAGGDYNTILANAQHLSKQRGFTAENLQAQFDKMKDGMSSEEYQVFSADRNKLFGPLAPPAKAPTSPAAAPTSTQKPLMGAPAAGTLQPGMNYKALQMGQGQAPAGAPGLTYAPQAAQGAPIMVQPSGTMGQVSPNNVSPSNGPLTLRQAQQPTRVSGGRTPLTEKERKDLETISRQLAERANKRNQQARR